MDKLDEFRESLIVDGKRVPHFSSKDGRSEAKVLFVLSDPGPKVNETMVIDRDNPDQTARNFTRANDEAGLDRKETISWNIVPWFTESVKSKDIKDGTEHLIRLCDPKYLPGLKVVVLMGENAKKAKNRLSQLSQDRPDDLTIIESPHPGGQAMTRSGNRERLHSAVLEAKRIIESG